MAERAKAGGIYWDTSLDKTGFQKGIDGIKKESNEVGNLIGGKLKGIMVGFGAAMAGAFAVKSLIQFGSEAQKLYIKQFQAETKLQTMMKNTGVYTQQNVEEMKKFAGELQKASNYGDEAIMPIIGDLAKARLNVDQLKQATQSYFDMQAAGVSGDMMTKALDRPLEMSDSLRRMGIFINKELLKTLDLEQQRSYLLDEINKRYGGMAKAMIDPYTQINNVIGDIKEKFGALFYNILTPGAQFVLDMVSGLDNMLAGIDPEKVGKEFQSFFRELSLLFNDLKSVLIETIGDSGSGVWQAVKAMKDFIVQIIKLIRESGILKETLRVNFKIFFEIMETLSLLSSIANNLNTQMLKMAGNNGSFSLMAVAIKATLSPLWALGKSLEVINDLLSKIDKAVKESDGGVIYEKPEDVKKRMDEISREIQKREDQLSQATTEKGKARIQKSMSFLKLEMASLKKLYEDMTKTGKGGDTGGLLDQVLTGGSGAGDTKDWWNYYYGQIKQDTENLANDLVPIIENGVIVRWEESFDKIKDKHKGMLDDMAKQTAKNYVQNQMIGDMASGQSAKAKEGAGAMQAVVSGATTGGWIGAIVAVIGVLVQRISKITTVFGDVFEFVIDIFDSVAKILLPIFEILNPILIILNWILAPLKIFGELIKKMVDVIKILIDPSKSIVKAYEEKIAKLEKDAAKTRQMLDAQQKQLEALNSIKSSVKRAADIQRELLQLEEDREKAKKGQPLTVQLYQGLLDRMERERLTKGGSFDFASYRSVIGADGSIDRAKIAELQNRLQFSELDASDIYSGEAKSELEKLLGMLSEASQTDEEYFSKKADLEMEYMQVQNDLKIAMESTGISAASMGEELWNLAMKIGQVDFSNLTEAMAFSLIVPDATIDGGVRDIFDTINQKIKDAFVSISGLEQDLNKKQTEIDLKKGYLDYLREKAGGYVTSNWQWWGGMWIGQNVYYNQNDATERVVSGWLTDKNKKIAYLNSIGMQATSDNLGKFKTGTPWTGFGSVDEVAGITHKMESVIPYPYSAQYQPQIQELLSTGKWSGSGNYNLSIQVFPRNYTEMLSQIDNELAVVGKKIMVVER